MGRYTSFGRLFHYLRITLAFSFVILFFQLPELHAAGDTAADRLEKIRNRNARSEIASIKRKPVGEASTTHRPPINRPLTLQDAISFALTYNLEAAIKKLESDIQQEAAVGAKLKMLPSLTLDGELSGRNNFDASYSDPLFESGEQDYNYSRDKQTQNYKVELSWDLLDFGIAYIQHRQSVNRIDIIEQQRRRVIQNLKLDVTKTFWQIMAAKAAVDMADGFVEQLREREQILEKQITSRSASELEALETSVILSEIKMNMSGFEQDLLRYKNKLAALMGMPEAVDLEIAAVDFNTRLEEEVDIDIASLENQALRQRPELFEQDIEELITLDDAHIAIAKFMPKPSLFYRYSYDADSHLYDNQWHTVGVRLSFDLLSLPQKVSQKREVAIKKQLVRTRRLSIAAAVLTQLRIAVVDFEDAMKTYKYATEIADKRKRLAEARRRHARLGNGTYEDVLESEAKHLLASVRSLTAYAELMIAEQRILNSTGSDDIGRSRFLVTKLPKTPSQSADALERKNK